MNRENTFMFKEILEQTSVMESAYKTNISKIKEIVKLFKEKDLSNIYVVARGSSNHAGQYFKYLCEVYAHIPVGFIYPSVVTLYGASLNYQNSLVIGISQSGSGLDINSVILDANKSNTLTVSVTNNPDSIVAKSAAIHLHLNVGEEKSVAATKTMTSEMYILALLVMELTNNDELRKELDYKNVQNIILKAIENKENIFDLAEKCLNYYDAYMLSRGINYVSSLESALKLQETTYVKSKGFAISDFYHGPFAIVDDKTNIFLLHGKGKDDKDAYEMFDKLRVLKANIIVLSNDEYFAKCEKLIKLPQCSELISPFAIITSMQLFALGLSTAKGLNPDQPRGLKKVTVTK